MTTTFDIDTLRALVAIVDFRSFSRAADVLGRSQSAISLQIARLESLVGHSLLQRSRGRVTGPTVRGMELIAHARQIIDLNERAVAAMRRPAAVDRIRIGFTADALERGLPSIMDDIRSQYPGTQLALHTDLSARLTDDLDHGRLDLAVFKRTPSNQAGAAICMESLAWFGAIWETARRDAPVPLVLFAEGCAYRDAALRCLDQAGCDWRIACEVHTMPSLRAAVHAGLGYTALPVHLAAGETMTIVRDLPALPAVELAVGIAASCELPTAHAIGALIARHYVEG